MNTIRRNLIILLITLFYYLTAKADWELTGPGDAFVTSIFFNGKNLYCGSKGMVNLSTNKGKSWIPLNNIGKVTFDYIYAVIVNNQKIFVGTIKGLYTSTDNGESWKLDSINGEVSVIWDIKKRGNDLFFISGGNLYLSKDNGISFIQITDNTFPSIQKLDVNGDKIFAGGSGFIDQPNFIMSKNNGNSWKIIKDTLSGLKTEAITAIAANGDYIFLGCKETGLLISSDDGETWEKNNPELLKSSPINTILCSNDTIYVGSELGLYFSADFGKTWLPTTFQLPTREIIKNNNEFFIASDGVGISTDYGGIWRLEEKGLGNVYVFDIALHDKDIFAGTYNAGVYFYSTESDNWKQFLPLSNYLSIQDIEFLDSNIFVTRYNSLKVMYSNNFGGIWKNLVDSNGILDSKIYCIAPDKEKRNVFAGNKMGLYISKDFGNHWELVNEDLKIIPITQIIIVVDTIYVTANQFNMYISYDYGKTFKTYNTDNGLPYDSYYTAMELCGNNIIIGTYYLGSSGKPKGIFFSKDKGVTWNPANINSPLNNITDLISFDSFVFAGTDSGIILSSDCGENWFRPNDDLHNFPIYKLLIYHKNIYAATNLGVFKAPLSNFGIVNVEEQITESKNYLYFYPPYPNPTTNIVRSLIYWDTSIDIENDDIAVFDIFGNKVADKEKITIEKQNAYSGLLTWNCSSVPNGIYLIKIAHGTETKTMKIIVNK